MNCEFILPTAPWIDYKSNFFGGKINEFYECNAKRTQQ